MRASGAFSVFSSASRACAAARSTASATGTLRSLPRNSSACSFSAAITSSSRGSLRSWISRSVTFCNCAPTTSCGTGTPVCLTDSHTTGVR